MQRVADDLFGFVVEICSRPVLVLSAPSMSRACELCSQQWFADELLQYRSSGSQVWDGQTSLTIRPARSRELAELEIARMRDRMDHFDETTIFAFLIPLDSEMQ
jgi:hypothetical protein